MDTIIALIAIAIGVSYAFRHGKHIGSRKAFGAGYRRARKRFRRKSGSQEN